jgi:hypothetical protein
LGQGQEPILEWSASKEEISRRKKFYLLSLKKSQNKLEHLSLENLKKQVYYLWVRPGAYPRAECLKVEGKSFTIYLSLKRRPYKLERLSPAGLDSLV